MITEIKEGTKVNDVFSEYPDLKLYLIKKYPELKAMNSFTYRLLLKRATVGQVCDKMGIKLSELNEEFLEFLNWRKK